jgi:hypothetical protein
MGLSWVVILPLDHERVWVLLSWERDPAADNESLKITETAPAYLIPVFYVALCVFPLKKVYE